MNYFFFCTFSTFVAFSTCSIFAMDLAVDHQEVIVVLPHKTNRFGQFIQPLPQLIDVKVKKPKKQSRLNIAPVAAEEIVLMASSLRAAVSNSFLQEKKDVGLSCDEDQCNDDLLSLGVISLDWFVGLTNQEINLIGTDFTVTSLIDLGLFEKGLKRQRALSCGSDFSLISSLSSISSLNDC